MAMVGTLVGLKTKKYCWAVLSVDWFSAGIALKVKFRKNFNLKSRTFVHVVTRNDHALGVTPDSNCRLYVTIRVWLYECGFY